MKMKDERIEEVLVLYKETRDIQTNDHFIHFQTQFQKYISTISREKELINFYNAPTQSILFSWLLHSHGLIALDQLLIVSADRINQYIQDLHHHILQTIRSPPTEAYRKCVDEIIRYLFVLVSTTTNTSFGNSRHATFQVQDMAYQFIGQDANATHITRTTTREYWLRMNQIASGLHETRGLDMQKYAKRQLCRIVDLSLQKNEQHSDYEQLVRQVLSLCSPQNIVDVVRLKLRKTPNNSIAPVFVFMVVKLSLKVFKETLAQFLELAHTFSQDSIKALDGIALRNSLYLAEAIMLSDLSKARQIDLLYGSWFRRHISRSKEKDTVDPFGEFTAPYDCEKCGELLNKDIVPLTKKQAQFVGDILCEHVQDVPCDFLRIHMNAVKLFEQEHKISLSEKSAILRVRLHDAKENANHPEVNDVLDKELDALAQAYTTTKQVPKRIRQMQMFQKVEWDRKIKPRLLRCPLIPKNNPKGDIVRRVSLYASLSLGLYKDGSLNRSEYANYVDKVEKSMLETHPSQAKSIVLMSEKLEFSKAIQRLISSFENFVVEALVPENRESSHATMYDHMSGKLMVAVGVLENQDVDREIEIILGNLVLNACCRLYECIYRSGILAYRRCIRALVTGIRGSEKLYLIFMRRIKDLVLRKLSQCVLDHIQIATIAGVAQVISMASSSSTVLKDLLYKIYTSTTNSSQVIMAVRFSVDSFRIRMADPQSVDEKDVYFRVLVVFLRWISLRYDVGTPVDQNLCEMHMCCTKELDVLRNSKWFCLSSSILQTVDIWTFFELHAGAGFDEGNGPSSQKYMQCIGNTGESSSVSACVSMVRGIVNHIATCSYCGSNSRCVTKEWQGVPSVLKKLSRMFDVFEHVLVQSLKQSTLSSPSGTALIIKVLLETIREQVDFIAHLDARRRAETVAVLLSFMNKISDSRNIGEDCSELDSTFENLAKAIATKYLEQATDIPVGVVMAVGHYFTDLKGIGLFSGALSYHFAEMLNSFGDRMSSQLLNQLSSIYHLLWPNEVVKTRMRIRVYYEEVNPANLAQVILQSWRMKSNERNLDDKIIRKVLLNPESKEYGIEFGQAMIKLCLEKWRLAFRTGSMEADSDMLISCIEVAAWVLRYHRNTCTNFDEFHVELNVCGLTSEERCIDCRSFLQLVMQLIERENKNLPLVMHEAQSLDSIFFERLLSKVTYGNLGKES